MKRILVVVVLFGLVAAAAAAPKAVRSYDWNDHRYTVVVDAGRRVEIKGDLDMKADAAIAAFALVPAPQVESPPVLLATCSLAELTAEIVKRQLTAADLRLKTETAK